MGTVQGGEESAGMGWLRASDADREEVVDLVKAAFTEGLLTKDELGVRVGRALTARTYADLATVTADIPAGAVLPRQPAPATSRRRPGPRGKALACLIVATVAMLVDGAFTTNGASATANLFYLLFIMAFVAAFITWLCTLVADQEDPASGQPPQRPAPGGHDEVKREPETAARSECPPPDGQGGRQVTRAAGARIARKPATSTVPDARAA